MDNFDKFYELAKAYYIKDRIFYESVIRPILNKIDAEKNRRRDIIVCSNCGKENNILRYYCHYCGSSLENQNLWSVGTNYPDNEPKREFATRIERMHNEEDFKKSEKRSKYFHYTFISLGILSLAVLLFVLITRDTAEDLLAKGNIEANSGNDSMALYYLTKCIELKPDFIKAYDNRGYIYYKQENYIEAIRDFTFAIDNKTADEMTFFCRGKIYDSWKDYSKAINDFSAAIKLNPNFAAAYHMRADAYAYLRYYEKALSDYSREIELIPDKPELYLNRGLIYGTTIYNLKDRSKALQDFSSAILLKPDYADAYYYRCILYYELKDYDKTMKDYEVVAKLSDTLKGLLSLMILYDIFKMKNEPNISLNLGANQLETDVIRAAQIFREVSRKEKMMSYELKYKTLSSEIETKMEEYKRFAYEEYVPTANDFSRLISEYTDKYGGMALRDLAIKYGFLDLLAH